MSPKREIEIAVFDAARRIHGLAERKTFIDWAFRDAPEEAQRMNAVLDEEGDAQDWFKRCKDTLTGIAAEIVGKETLELPNQLLDAAELDDLSRSIASRYTILQRIGGGGGGQVFLADELRPVQRKVAIKLLQFGLETRLFLAAFQREQRILAAMNHPNIAAILDTGTTLAGRPFLVMEYVDGVSITAYCDTRRLTLRQRLDLFLQVCSAVQYAHQKGVIHRDLKPSNILITHGDSRPLVKVIDFGIASEGSGDTPQPSGTPAYMSSGQAAGEIDTDTLDDVYSMGVVLYEMLAGPPPWAPHRLEETASLVSHHLAGLAAPELAKLADVRRLKSREFVARLRGDLEAIIAKAIAIDRRQRYDTIDSFAADIHRHLGGFPVKARPASVCYVAVCFFTRHRLVSYSIAAILLALVLGTVIAVNFYVREHRAHRAADLARKEAENARAKAARLFAQASARENITRAAILLEQKQIEEADALLKITPISEIEPSTEASYVFRLLGERNAMLGRWKEASECYSRLMIANRLLPAERVGSGFDFIWGAPAVLEAGDVGLYDAMRKDMLTRMPKTINPMVAEHMVKGCLLTPPDRAMLEVLRPMADQMRPKGGGHNTSRDSLAAGTLLFDLRDGRFQSVYDGAESTLKSSRSPSFRARILIFRAMAAHALGKSDTARNDLAKAATMIEEGTLRVIVVDQKVYDASHGTWIEWAIARVFHREATALLAR